MTATDQYIEGLTRLKTGDLGLLRTHAGRGLDESVDGFDLFAGLWWPLREKSQFAPRRSVAWMIAKLYAFMPLMHSPQATLARELRRCAGKVGGTRVQQKFDEMLMLSLDQLEPALRWAVGCIADNGRQLDWVRLTDDLSQWERESTRLRWADEYLNVMERAHDNVD